MGIIAVAVRDPGLDGPIEPKFGRAPHLLLVDPETLEWEAVANPAAGADAGAGLRAARGLVERGVSAVASGDFGPNAHAALTSAGIETRRFPAGTTVREAVEAIAR
jgi:predicted Fe-Mo cluster-binding NifX family protein